MCQSVKQSRDDFKDVYGLEDLSLNNFPEEILLQCIFRNVLFLQKISYLMSWQRKKEVYNYII